MKKSDIKRLVREELQSIRANLDADCAAIAKKLEALRKKLEKEATERTERTETMALETAPRERRVDIKMVSDIIEVPVNELMLYFLNHVKTSPQRHMVEYHVGNVHFYYEAD